MSNLNLLSVSGLDTPDMISDFRRPRNLTVKGKNNSHPMINVGNLLVKHATVQNKERHVKIRTL